MKTLKNENGYALVLVLFLIVFITIMTAVFMRGAISNAKQERIVDDNNLSVVAAEMGVDYYSALFENEYYRVRDKIWDEEIAAFEEAINKPKSNPAALAKTHQKNIKEKIIRELERVNSTDSPEDVYFKAEGKQSKDKFFIPPAESPEEPLHVITVSGDVIGDYTNAKKTANLDFALLFELPNIAELIEGVEPPKENPNQGGGIVSSFSPSPIAIQKVGELLTLEPVRVDKDTATYISGQVFYGTNGNVSVERKGNIKLGKIEGVKGEVIVKAEGDFDTEKLYGNTSTLNIIANGTIKLSQIQDNTTTLNMSGNNSINLTSNMSNNKNVSIKTNGTFSGGLIQGNGGYLNIFAKGGFKNGSSNIYGNTKVEILTNGNFYSNGQIGENKESLKIMASCETEIGSLYKNVQSSLLTNGNFKTGSIEGNTVKLDIKTSGNFTSGKIITNDDVNILTNGSFTAGLIEQNKSGLTIKTKSDFTSGNFQNNKNSSVEVAGNFKADLIFNNEGSTKLKSTGNFTTTQQIQGNRDLKIHTNGDFQSKQLYGNGTSAFELLSLGNINITEQVQDNHNTLIMTNGNFTTGGVLYGNKGIEIHSKGNFTTKNIQDNTNLKIVAYSDFKADNIYLGSNNMICVGGNYTASRLDTGYNSFVYVRDAKYANGGNIKHLEKEQWEKTCGAKLANDQDMPPIDIDTPDWEIPKIEVEYN